MRFPAFPLAPRCLASFVAFVVIAASVLSASGQTHRRVYMLGNSLTDDVLYDGFVGIVAQGNRTVALGSHRTPGAPINWLWDNPTQTYTVGPYGYYPSAFANYGWDAVTLQPFSTYAAELQHARFFAQALRGAGTFGPADPVTPTNGAPTGISPDGTIYIYAQWPGNLTGDWKSATWLTTTPRVENTAAYFDEFVPELRSLEPASKFFLIPVGHVFHELYQLTRAGRLPGITSHSDFMEDGRHLNNRGSYVAGLTFYAVIYKADPRGMAVPPPYTATPEQAAVIQEAVWKIVNLHPLTGLRSTITITTPSLPDTLEGRAFTTTLTSAQASGAVTWSVSGGALPAGVTLSSNGTLSGTPAAAGNYSFKARAADTGGNSVEREFILFVLSNNPPVITNATLPAAPRGAAYAARLASTGGFGEITWSIKSGDLPTGLTLSSDGMISGAPVSVTGNYAITFRAADSLPGTPSTGEKTLTIPVTAPEAGTLIAAPLTTPPTVNGSLSESFWTLPHTANRPQWGAVNNTAAFSVRWTSSALYIAARVVDANVVTGDAVHIFLDSRHDRELAYNSDDRHIVVSANGTLQERNNRPSGITAAAAPTADGYAVEVMVPLANLERDGSQSLTLGFDLGVEDVDAAGGPAAWQAWLGTSAIDPIPLTMGNLLLSLSPIATNLLVNGDFTTSPLASLPYPGRATTSLAGLGWYRNGVAGRPFTVVDKLNYGFPNKALVPNGVSPGCGAYQVLFNGKTAKGRGYLRMDVKIASSFIKLRVFGYSGNSTQVDAKLNAQLQQDPISGGTPDATLLSTTMAAVPVSTTWREAVFPVDFGNGYDYYVVGMSAPGDTTTTLYVPTDSRIDNVAFGPEQAETALGMTPEPVPTVTLETLDATGAELGANKLSYRVRRSAASPFSLPVQAVLGGTAQAGVDYAHPAHLVIPGRSADLTVELTPVSDQMAEGGETVTFALSANATYTLGASTTANGTIADHPVDAWHFQNFGATSLNPARDSDGDGFADLVELTVGSNPFSAASRPDMRLAPGAGAGALEASYAEGTPTDGSVPSFEWSDDLTTWNPLPANDPRLTALPGSPLSDGRTQRRWSLQPESFTSGDRFFLRLRADRQ